MFPSDCVSARIEADLRRGEGAAGSLAASSSVVRATSAVHARRWGRVGIALAAILVWLALAAESRADESGDVLAESTAVVEDSTALSSDEPLPATADPLGEDLSADAAADTSSAEEAESPSGSDTAVPGDSAPATTAPVTDPASEPASGEPVALDPEPVASDPEPVAPAPEPVAPAPEPVAPAPEPVVVAPEPVAPAPEPVAVAPEPVASAPEPVADPATPTPSNSPSESIVVIDGSEASLPQSSIPPLRFGFDPVFSGGLEMPALAANRGSGSAAPSGHQGDGQVSSERPGRSPLPAPRRDSAPAPAPSGVGAGGSSNGFSLGVFAALTALLALASQRLGGLLRLTVTHLRPPLLVSHLTRPG